MATSQRPEVLLVTKAQLRLAFMDWTRDQKLGRTTTRDEVKALGLDVEGECAEYLWRLLLRQQRFG